MDDKIYKFLIEGRPKVQKNDNAIYKSKGRLFIGHSKLLSETRDEVTLEIFDQFIEQGGVNPIDYLCAVSFVFYCPAQAEPDLDNLPAIILDAIQGQKEKGSKERMMVVLKNDKLVRVINSEKIVKGDPRYFGEPRTEIEISKYLR
jgi:hypothetical protein